MEVVGDIGHVHVVGCGVVTVSSWCGEVARKGRGGVVVRLWLYGGRQRWALAKKKATSLVVALLGRRRAVAVDGELRKRSGYEGICRRRRLGFQGL